LPVAIPKRQWGSKKEARQRAKSKSVEIRTQEGGDVFVNRVGELDPLIQKQRGTKGRLQLRIILDCAGGVYTAPDFHDGV